MMTCEWELEDDQHNIWQTGCGQMFIIIEGSPPINNMNYCCFCGLNLIVNDKEE